MFEGLKIWNNEKFRKLQGTYPVLSLSFANIKETNYETARKKICQILSNLYSDHNFLIKENVLDKREEDFSSQHP